MIPNPPNDPADDVSTMQTNAGSISSIIAVDHVGFNVAGGGQHAQVTFNANNVPTLPASPPVLFTDLPSNHSGSPSYPELFFYSGSVAQSSSQYSLGGIGSTLLLGGVILKWGNFTMGSGITSFNVVFAGDFPNNKFTVVVSATSGNANDVISASVDSNKHQFTATRAITNALPYYYIAIGN